ncbi:MAG: putative oxidoreductase [Ilumatobacteraceae bacterium]|nr:putative oxidoreductase [Ilumatobacteraceae bacterium]
MTDIAEQLSDGGYQLSDRYTRDTGRVFVSGVQAMARIPLEQMRVDRLGGLRTAAFVSGYPGSPLAGFDKEASAASKMAGGLPYVHTPALNEELAATAVMGSQLAAEQSDCRYDGIVGFWYGKTPGVDRASDALRHAQFAGVHRNGGAVAFVGDDAAAKSSTLPSSSDAALIGLHIPILTPGDVQDVIDLGRHAIALSRASGLWAGLKVVAPVADGTGTLELGLDRIRPIIPHLEVGGRPFVPHADGNLLTPHTLDLEHEMIEVRLELARMYGAENRLNVVTVDPSDAWIGLAACGHTYHELRQALSLLGLATDEQIAAVGIRLLQLRMPSPIDPALVRRFADGLAEIMIVEDKNPTLEVKFRDALYPSPHRPLITGKRDGLGHVLLPSHGSLDADSIVGPLRARLAQRVGEERLAPVHSSAGLKRLIPLSINRTPYFCSGCPHNISTQVPDGSTVGGGIGCHSMVAMMEADRVGNLVGLTCMGNEGAQWIGMAPFVETPHLIQNLGDGTFAHSGQLAVRAAIASGVNITYKILVNGVVAMTGGQDPQGAVDVPTMARMLLLQGVQQVVITTDDLDRYDDVALPTGTEVWDRSRIIEAQELLASVRGTTVLLHDQACAAEKRRLRKRNLVPTPSFRVVINERVCEGCGDCGQKSNCLSVQPVETEYGRKTRIDQSSCNLDFSCLNGDCPSFATVTPAKRRKWRAAEPRSKRQKQSAPRSIPAPTVIVDADELVVRMPGIGGTGVVTISQILGTAAMLEGFHVRGLDQTGLSQKAGPVVSDLAFSRSEQQGSNKASAGAVDVMLAFDLLAASSDAQLKGASSGRTIVIGSDSRTPTGSMILHPGRAYPERSEMALRLDSNSRAELNRYVPSVELATGLFGDAATANVLLLGVALQAGVIPISTANVERAIELNGVAVSLNLEALRWGRQWVVDASAVAAAAGLGDAARSEATEPTTTQALVEQRAKDLVAYQSSAYARRYTTAVDDLRTSGASDAVVEAFARNLYKLMAYKDEYEVARLLLAPEAKAAAVKVGGKGARVTWQLHPPLLRALGMKNKLKLGRSATPALMALRAGRRLRGTALDIPGWTSLRRTERALPGEYIATMQQIVTKAASSGMGDDIVLDIAALPDMIRGYESIKVANVEAYRQRLAELLTLVG